MNCHEVNDLLSAYVDGELTSDESEQVRQHVESCCTCGCECAAFQKMGDWMRQSESAVDTDALWDRMAPAIFVQPKPSKWSVLKWSMCGLALAASFGLVWLQFPDIADRFVLSPHGHGQHDHASLAVDFKEVLRSARSAPKTALSGLLASYQGAELSNEETVSFLGYEPTLFQTLPVGFVRNSTHVLNMPCCKCSATICAREDGSSFIVFEHKEEQPVWFGDSPSIETQCAGHPCRIVEAQGELAVSWKHNDRQLTMIGATDLSEVQTWIETLKL